MGKVKDISGQRFGRLVAIKIVGKNEHGAYLWDCECECGNKTIVTLGSLTTGNTKSCGCLQRDTAEKTIDTIHQSELVEGTSLMALTKKKSKSSTSGFKGVYLDKKSGKWRAEIHFKKELHYLGRFSDKQDAINARKEAEEKYFKPILEKYGKDLEGKNEHE